MKRMLFMMFTTLMTLSTGGVDGWGQDTWVRTFGGKAYEWSRSVTTADDGSVLATGWTDSNDNDFEGLHKGNRDIFVIKLDKAGKRQWLKTYGGTGHEGSNTIIVAADGSILIVGWTDSNDGDFKGMNKGNFDIFIMKLNVSGDVVWTKTFGGSAEDYATSITATSDGGILVSGTERIGEYLNPDIFIMKLNMSGEVLWKKYFRGNREDVTLSIATTSDDGFVITGYTTSYDGDDFKDVITIGSQDIFVIKYDKQGNVVWKKIYGGSGEDWSMSIAQYADGGYVLTGYTSSNNIHFEGMNKGKQDIFVIKLDKSGDLVWTRTFGGSGDDTGQSLTITQDGGIVVAGWTESTNGDFEGSNKGYTDIVVLKLDRRGDTVWKKNLGGEGQDICLSVTAAADSGILITGLTNSARGEFFRGLGWLGLAYLMKIDANGTLTPPTSVDVTSVATPLLVTPNPLSTSSTISYNLNAPSHIRVELISTMGQVVDVVFDGYRESGTQRVPLNVSSLTSGMYSVRMTSDIGIYTTQMCVVR